MTKVLSIGILTLLWTSLHAEATWNAEQLQVLESINALSATTAPNGAGPDAYGDILDDEFSRWTIGSQVINRKQAWVDGLREWFDDGWRVSDRKTQYLEILVLGDSAYTRRIVEETYSGPGNEQSVSSAALAEVWVHRNEGWRLLLVTVHPFDGD
ncbi:MAG: hypothetical protein DRQ63_08235 [Gammaproteobacteria bacterium]|nr:MAG: hypothetical protein DRQ63_08235 [Gammaproteobacteria bacterium]